MSADKTAGEQVTTPPPVAARDVHLVRGVTLAGAVAINAISMIGIGPLITIPLVLGALHGPLSLVGWVLGALIALCDGLVWSELGSLYPGSGGTYGYLLEIFGRARAGRLLAFLFVWQTIFVAPLNQATGYIGFANYAGYLFPKIGASPWGIKILAMCVGVATIIALYRGIKTISRIGLILGAASLLTLLCVIVGSYVHFSPAQALTLPDHDSIWSGLRAGLGQALIIAMYDYLGYNQSSCIGGEVVNPAKTIPRSIIISIVLIAVLYITMQLGIIGAISWKSLIPLADGSLPPLGQHVASAIVEHSFGVTAAGIVTGLILITAFASVYGNLLGYSRVPYAAAADGVFLRPFAHIDPKHKFPDVSLVVMGLIALVACLFSLDLVINALTTGIVLIQSITQIVALIVIRVRGIRAPYRMWLFPLPALLALAGWLYIFASAGGPAIAFGIVSLSAGAAVFFIRAAIRHDWPFGAAAPQENL